MTFVKASQVTAPDSASTDEDEQPYYGPGVDPTYKIPVPTRGTLAKGTKRIIDHLLAREKEGKVVFIYTGNRRTEILGNNVYTNTSALHPLLGGKYPLIEHAPGGRSAVHLAYRLTDLGRSLAR